MSNHIDYSPAFREEYSEDKNEINSLRETLRRVISQRDHYKEQSAFFQLRYAEVAQQLDDERRLTHQLTDLVEHRKSAGGV